MARAEQIEFYAARAREAEEERRAALDLRDFCAGITHTAESILPGIYFDAVQIAEAA